MNGLNVSSLRCSRFLSTSRRLCGCAALATGLSPCPVDPRGVEEGFMTIETISLDGVEDLIADGTLVDETTVLALLLARAHLAG